MSDFYRKKAKEDQLNKQVDEIYDIVFTGPKWLHLKFAEKHEKKLIMNEIKNSSYEEVKASKIKLAETNKTKIDSQWIPWWGWLLICFGAMVFFFTFASNFDYEATCIKYDLDC